MIIVGILLEVLAAALGTTSKQLIAYSEHAQKRWIFHLGAGINIFVGPVVDASAYAFAPQVVVAPFACLDVIFNALTAPYTLYWQNEKLTQGHVAGTGLVALGAVFTAVFGSVQDRVLTVYELEAQLTKPASLIYLAVELVAVLLVNLCLRARHAALRGISFGIIAGVLMGNVFCIKGLLGIVRTSISTGQGDAWLRPTPYILLIAAAGGAILGHVYMRRGLGEYKGIFMVTIFEGAHITAACLSGCVVMEEMAHAPWQQYVAYWCSVLAIVAGIILMNTSSRDSQLDESARQKSFSNAMQSFASSKCGAPRIAGYRTQEPGTSDMLACAAGDAALAASQKNPRQRFPRDESDEREYELGNMLECGRDPRSSPTSTSRSAVALAGAKASPERPPAKGSAEDPASSPAVEEDALVDVGRGA